MKEMWKTLVCLNEKRWLCCFVVFKISNLILDLYMISASIVNIYISFYLLLRFILKNVFSLGKFIISRSRTTKYGGDLREVDLFKLKKMAAPFCSF